MGKYLLRGMVNEFKDSRPQKAFDRRGCQHQAVLGVEEHEPVAELAKELIEVFLKPDESGFLAPHLFAEKVELGGQNAPLVVAIQGRRGGEFPAR